MADGRASREGGSPRPPASSRSSALRLVRRQTYITLDQAIVLLVAVAALPAVVVALYWLWTGGQGIEVRWTLTVLILGCWIGATIALQQRVVRPIQVLSNLLAALREGDYSVRASRVGTRDDLGVAMLEINQLGETLQEQRLGAVEASALLRTVMEEIDVAIFAFDEARRLVLVNREGERLLGVAADELLGSTAAELDLERYLQGAAPRTVDVTFPGGAGRWEIRRSGFRQEGRPHQLLVFADLSRALREEERQAWQRLIRVLSHEINNSLTPIKSIARSVRRILRRSVPDLGETAEEVDHGLAVIAGRSESLSRFMASYARLARLPRPSPRAVPVRAWVQRVVDLEKRLPAVVRPGPDIVIQADGDQLDQLLINLLRNAVDAALETGGGVCVGWRRDNGQVEVFVEDEGPGLADTANLFVPFFTTKPNGSGIGLALSRQIAEAHGGALTLQNRDDGRGCIARLRVPITPRRD